MKTVIETERLRLRAFKEDDVEAFFALASDPDGTRYITDTPIKTINEAHSLLNSASLQDYTEFGFGRFACEWKETGQVIGFSGLKFIRELKEVEFGSRFLPEWRGKGLATEAGAASLHFARQSLRLSRLIALVAPNNLASMRVAIKLGFAFETCMPLEVTADANVEIWSRSLT